MPYQTEDIFRKLQTYLEEHSDKIKSEEDLNKFTAEFILKYNQGIRSDTSAKQSPKTSDDYLELAENAPSHKEYLEYLNKALELDENNLDTTRMLIDETIDNPIKALEEYKKLVEKGAKILEKQGYFDEAEKYEFWLAFETRPYMRARYWYMHLLVDCGMMRQAALECEGMLKLCRDDNLGVRYELMHIYAFLEDEPSGTNLFNQYKEISTHFALPYAILYFKLGNLKKSADLLKKLAEKNKDTKKFLHTINSKNSSSMDKYMQEMDPYGERFNSIDEFLGELHNYEYLSITTPSFFSWANRELKKK